MALDLFKISDEIYALSDLRSDHLFEKIPKNKIRYYIVSSKNIGETVAKNHHELFKPEYVDEICKDRNIKVNLIEKEYRIGKINFRAEIHFRKRHINIMKNSIDQLYDSFKGRLSEKQIIDIHIAHEIFHLIEHDKKVKANQILDKIEVFRFGPFKRHSTIIKSSEIAAHFYCKTLLKLDFHPKALDFEYMLDQGSISGKELVKYFDNLKEILKSVN